MMMMTMMMMMMNFYHKETSNKTQHISQHITTYHNKKQHITTQKQTQTQKKVELALLPPYDCSTDSTTAVFSSGDSSLSTSSAPVYAAMLRASVVMVSQLLRLSMPLSVSIKSSKLSSFDSMLFNAASNVACTWRPVASV